MSTIDALLLDPYPLNFYIAQRSDGIFGSGTASDPWDGTGARFDARMVDIMNKVLAQQAGQTLKVGVQVLVGPGNFSTKGYSDDDSNTSGWVPFPGLKLTGAGVDVTVLTLVNASSATAQYFAVGHSLGTASPKINHVEISSLTIDCNLSANGAALGCGAIRLFGDHVRIRRVKAVNWGTKNNTKRCFVFAVITAAPSPSYSESVNAGIEDCIAITPGSTSQPVTIYHAGSKEDPLGDSKEAFGTAPFLRNCFADGGVASPSPSGNVRALSLGGCRGGVVEGNQILNVDVGGPYQDRASTRDLVIRGNLYRNVARGAYWNLGGNNQPPSLSLSSIAIEGDNVTADVTTSAADHGLKVGDVVELSGNTPTDRNGVFLVRNVPAANQFKVQRSTGFSAGSTTVGNARKLLSVGKLWMLDNYLEQASGVSPIAIHLEDNGKGAAPDYVFSEVFIRGNQLRYVDGPTPTVTSDVAMQVNGVYRLTGGDNLIESANSTPIVTTRCNQAANMVKLYDNVDPVKFIQGAEDALMVSLLTKR
jgi:hypothetical protein